ncbi:MAG: hypothetical protein CMM47_09410 [Rhodospirillaceae bacterium]|nr:hypothetical protein [Rhodospirillaceae bacterium]
MNDPLKPKLAKVVEMNDPRATALQFRYLFATDADGLKVFDATNPAEIHPIDDAAISLKDGRRIYLARTYAYVAAGSEGVAIVNIKNPEKPELYMKYDADGRIKDAHDVILGTTNASLIAYVADGQAGLKVIQLTSPDSQPRYYGYSPEPKPELIGWKKTKWPALSLSKGLARDRGVDETGGQMAVFGRLGSRPFTLKEQQKLYLDTKGDPWVVSDEVRKEDFVPGTGKQAKAD